MGDGRNLLIAFGISAITGVAVAAICGKFVPIAASTRYAPVPMPDLLFTAWRATLERVRQVTASGRLHWDDHIKPRWRTFGRGVKGAGAFMIGVDA